MNNSDSDSFSKTIYIHWPSSPFKSSLVINHTTSIFLTLSEIMENVGRTENIDCSRYQLVLNKEGQDIPLDMKKTLSEYPADEFILRPLKIEKDIQPNSIQSKPLPKMKLFPLNMYSPFKCWKP